MNPQRATVHRTGLLIQGKTAKRHNRLPSNHSTKKERLLLEGLNRARPLSVFRDIGLRSPIGTYTFGNGTGLNDCARYLVMAMTMQWDCPLCAPLSPLQIGWPKSRASQSLDPTIDFVQSMRSLATTGGIGRQIQDKGPNLNCEWSRMIWDLLGDYEPIEMRGYGGHRRVNTSSTHTYMAASARFSWEPPEDNKHMALESFNRPPAISVVQVNVRSALPDQVFEGRQG